MRRTSFRLAAIAVAAGSVLLFASLASAGNNFTTTNFTVACTSTGELCSTVHQETATTSSKLSLEFTSVWTGCSDFSVTFFVDGAAVFTSPVLAPNVSTGTILVPGPIASGTHTVAIQATGALTSRTGGCNTGTLTGWGGAFTVGTDGVPTPPVPPPPPPPPPPVTAPPPPATPPPALGPTSPEQCKKGGWATFVSPHFKNQGACVSYVEHLRERNNDMHDDLGDILHTADQAARHSRD